VLVPNFETGECYPAPEVELRVGKELCLECSGVLSFLDVDSGGLYKWLYKSCI